MKHFLAASLWVICSVAIFALSEDDLNTVSFTNSLSNGKSIDYLFFSPADSDYWGPDVLDKEHNLPNGQKLEFNVFYPDASGTFDFMAVDNAGTIYEIKGIEIKDGKTKSVLISDKNRSDKTIESLNMTEIIVSNETENDMNYLFLSPADSKIYGLDLLSVDSLLPAGQKRSYLVLLAGEKFDLDLLGLDAEQSVYEKTITVGTEEDTLYYAITEADISEE